jgi:hypothetical protein
MHLCDRRHRSPADLEHSWHRTSRGSCRYTISSPRSNRRPQHTNRPFFFANVSHQLPTASPIRRDFAAARLCARFFFLLS